jgi:hypothetical protein
MIQPMQLYGGLSLPDEASKKGNASVESGPRTSGMKHVMLDLKGILWAAEDSFLKSESGRVRN